MKNFIFFIISDAKKIVNKSIPVDVMKAKSVFLWLLFFYLLFFGTVVFSGYEYLDDRMRAYFNYYYWNVEGRYFLYFFYKFFSLDGVLRSIWPIGQVVSIMIMPFIGISLLIIRKLSKPEIIILSLSIFCNPLFLENISYHFDAVGMVLAAITAVFSALLIIWHKGILYYAIALIALSFSLFCYQISINIFACVFFPLLVFVAATRDTLYAIKKLMICLIILALSIIVYEVAVSFSFLFSHNQRNFEVVFSIYSVKDIFISVLRFYSYILSWCGKKYLLAFSILWGLLLFVPVYCKKSTLNFFVSSIFSILSIASIMGPMLILSDIPVWPRIYMGVGAAIFSCSLVVILVYKKIIKMVVFFTLIIMFIYSLKMSLIYGNLLISQKSYENFYLHKIVDEVNHEYYINNVSELRINKKLPRDVLVEKAAREIPLIDKLISSPVDNKWLWINNSLYEFGLNKNIVISTKENTDCSSSKEIFICKGAIYYK